MTKLITRLAPSLFVPRITLRSIGITRSVILHSHTNPPMTTCEKTSPCVFTTPSRTILPTTILVMVRSDEIQTDSDSSSVIRNTTRVNRTYPIHNMVITSTIGKLTIPSPIMIRGFSSLSIRKSSSDTKISILNSVQLGYETIRNTFPTTITIRTTW